MIILAADTQRDQEMIDKFQRAYENLKKIVDRQNRKIRILRISLRNTRRGILPVWV
jgi:hypothetical protein